MKTPDYFKLLSDFNHLYKIYEKYGFVSEEEVFKKCCKKYYLGYYPETKDKLYVSSSFIFYILSNKGHAYEGSIKPTDIEEIYNLPNFSVRMSDKYKRGKDYDLFFTKSINRDGYYEWLAKKYKNKRKLFHFVYKNKSAIRYISNNKSLIKEIKIVQYI